MPAGFFLLGLDLDFLCFEGGELGLEMSSSLAFFINFFSSMDPLLGLLLKSRGNPKDEAEEDEETDEVDETDRFEDMWGAVEPGVPELGCGAIDPNELDVEIGENVETGKPKASERVGGGTSKGPDPDPAASRLPSV